MVCKEAGPAIHKLRVHAISQDPNPPQAWPWCCAAQTCSRQPDWEVGAGDCLPPGESHNPLENGGTLLIDDVQSI